jgi:hypothetical protein
MNFTRILYRKNCCDSFAAVFAVWKFINNNNRIDNENENVNVNENVKFEAIDFNDPIPNLENENILILGFSYNRVIIEDLLNVTYNLLIIDHHESTLRSVGDLNCSIIDTNKSTSHLTWEYFNLGEVPVFIKLLEDRELEKWEFSYSEDFLAYFYTCVPFKFECFDEFINNEKVLESIEKGKNIQEFKNSIIKVELDRSIPINFFKKNAYIVNTSRMINDIGRAMLNNLNSCDISIIWYYDHKINKIRFTIRTNKDYIDVNKISKKFKGNGNRICAKFIYDDTIENFLKFCQR